MRTGQDASGSLQLSRRLHPYERFSLQGFPPVVATGLSRLEHEGLPCRIFLMTRRNPTRELSVVLALGDLRFTEHTTQNF